MSNTCCSSNKKENITSALDQKDPDQTDVCCSQEAEENAGCCSKTQDKKTDETAFAEGETTTYRIQGMDCPSCASTIEKALNKLKDIQGAKVNYNTAKLQVAGDLGVSSDFIVKEVEKLGFAVEPILSNKHRRTYDVEGMDCGSCAQSIEKHLNAMSSVHHVNVHFSTGKMTVDHENSVDEIIKEVSKIGYSASLHTKQSIQDELKSTKKQGYELITFSGILILLGFIGSYNGVSPLLSTILYAVAMVISGYKPVKSAFYAIKSRSLDMNVLMSAAAIGAALIGEWFEGATVVWLFALGNVLQNRSIEQTRKSISNLMELAPSEAGEIGFIKVLHY